MGRKMSGGKPDTRMTVVGRGWRPMVAWPDALFASVDA